MNSIIRLQSSDMYLDQGTKGPILCNGIKGLSLVMFYSSIRCKISEALFPRFKYLPQMINGCKFCVLNIIDHPDVIGMSEQTIAPIRAVPYIVFYVNGKPFLQYDDEPTLEKLANFVTYSMKLLESKKSFIDKGAKIESDIPGYCTNKPYLDFKCDSETNFCYLTYSDAYGKPRQANTQMHPSSEQHFQRN
jgi:hypothetical protein